MKLFQRIFFAAVLSGLAAGLAMSAVQQWRVAPLILEAETYENAAPAAEHSHDAGTAAATTEAAAPADDHHHDEEAWAPQDGTERVVYTVLANVLGAIGFAFLLAAVSVLSGIEITTRNGLIWGLGGFIALQLAPAVGLPPELPGMPAADLVARQAWWIGTAIATGAGILAIARLRNWTGLAIAVVLIAAPHVIGAPPAPHEPSGVPAHLATAYAANALATGALFWLIAGPLLGWLNERFAKSEAFALKGAHA
ncbi:CbtA family protein [Devosia sp. ZB163]|uniref:CbtA family protein n=1 Tax=Devosia sp. ZB163 TaxID=3025938 RepID=UPI0023602516|nr:CbtA family protein [Devosia sp. ZB163]MDC9823187.1 CbtA family protein [Devosia sp. ZB163]